MFLALPSDTPASRNFFSSSARPNASLGKNRTAPLSSAEQARTFVSVSKGPVQAVSGKLSSMALCHRAIDQSTQGSPELHPARRVCDHLGHEDHDHLFDWINEKGGGGHSAPGELPCRAGNAHPGRVQGDRHAQAEADAAIAARSEEHTSELQS